MLNNLVPSLSFPLTCYRTNFNYSPFFLHPLECELPELKDSAFSSC